MLRRLCTLKSILFNKIFFYKLIFNYVHEKIPQGGCTTPPNVSKLGFSGVKNTAKTNIDLNISCCIQVEYSVFFHW